MRSLDASLPPISPHIEAKYTAEPVWRFIDDCIGMSFAVEMREMGTKSPTGIIIDDLMEQRYGLAPTITSDRRVNKGPAQAHRVQGSVRVRAPGDRAARQQGRDQSRAALIDPGAVRVSGEAVCWSQGSE
jgi:hypothetical protein